MSMTEVPAVAIGVRGVEGEPIRAAALLVARSAISAAAWHCRSSPRLAKPSAFGRRPSARTDRNQ